MPNTRQTRTPERPRRGKQQQLIASVRERIVKGDYGPGQRLPTHVELLREFGVSSVTIQRALDRLTADGVISPRGRQGTFVADTPPHLHDYALTFPQDPVHPPGAFTRFYATLLQQAVALSTASDRQVIPFYGMDFIPQAPDFPRLVKRIESQRLAGIVFSTNPFRLVGTPVLDHPGIPRVALMSEHVYPNVPTVWCETYLAKALNYLETAGRKRIAVVGNVADDFEVFQAMLAARGMSTRRSWAMPITAAAVEGARVFVELLMEGRERPDALLICDENLAEPSVAGLIAAGALPGDDLELVAHCSFPWTGSRVVPVKRIGYDTRAVLHTCLDLIDRQRRGEAVPEMTMIPALFEDELPPAAASIPAHPSMRTNTSSILKGEHSHEP